MSNVIIYTKFLSEKFPILVEYEFDNEQLEVLSIRLIRKVVNGGQVYSGSKMDLTDPIYEAAWIYGKPGVKHILTSHQLCLIDDLTMLAIHGPHDSVPEDQIVYVEVQNAKP
jgi:hypothetical protein